MRRSPDGGRTFPRSSSKGYRYEVAIQPTLPNRPTTVPVYDHATTAGRLLVLDLDASRVPPEGAADRAGFIGAVAERAVELVAECGGRALVDRSPSGGAHVYVLWAEPIPFLEMRQMARAFALRFAPVVDTSPMQHTDAQIRGPGAPHKIQGGRLTGFMTLTCSVEEAEAICAAPCGPDVWAALHDELAAELDAAAGVPASMAGTVEARHPQAPDAAPGVELDVAGEPFRTRLGGRSRQLSEELEHTARTGTFDSAKYASSSEARQAVLNSAAARGWRLEQVRTALSGPWAAITDWWRDDALLRFEWAKAIAFTSPDPTPSAQKVGDPVRDCNTSGLLPTPPRAPDTLATTATPRPPGLEAGTDNAPDLYDVKEGIFRGMEVRPVSWQLTEYQQIRTWQSAMLMVERLQELDWGERALTYRSILRAIGAAAQMTGATTIEWGTRQLAYAAGVDHTTVSRALRELREGPYALIDLVQDAQGVRADLYQLVIPDTVAAEATRRCWRPGRIEAIHPAFRVVGRAAAFMYEALTSDAAPVADLAVAALLPRSTAYDALTVLAEHGLAERTPTGWRRGPITLDAVATQTGATDQAAAQLAGHRADRVDWHILLGILAAPESSTDTTNNAEPEAAPQAAPNAEGPPSGHRPGPRRPAPAWLVPPPRQPITEADLPQPSEIQAALRALVEAAPPQSGFPDDVRIAIQSDLASYDDRPAGEPLASLAVMADPAQGSSRDRSDAPQRLSEPSTGTADPPVPPTPIPPPVREIITIHGPEHEAAATRGAALARDLLTRRGRR